MAKQKEWTITAVALMNLAVPLVAAGVSPEDAMARVRRSLRIAGGATEFTEAQAIDTLRLLGPITLCPTCGSDDPHDPDRQ